MRAQIIRYFVLAIIVSLYCANMIQATSSNPSGGSSASPSSGEHSSKGKGKSSGESKTSTTYHILFFEGSENDHGMFYNFIHGKIFLVLLGVVGIGMTALGVFGVVKHGGVISA